MGALDELDLTQKSERDPEQVRKKAEYDEKHREKRNQQKRAHSVRGSRLEPGETARQQRHKQGRGAKAGQAGHRDTRKSPVLGSPQGDRNQSAATHWRKEAEKTKKGTSVDLMNTKGGTRFAKSAHKSAINRGREERGAKALEGVQFMKTNKTMTLIDASSHRERIANKKMMNMRPMSDAEKAQKRKTYKRKPGTLDSEASKHGSSVVGRNYEGKDSNWIQGAEKDIERRGTEGKCTPITKPGCTGKAKALAKTFKKMAKKRDAEVESKEEKGMTKEHLEILARAAEIIGEMTAVGSIGANMAGSSNRDYDTDAKPMGKDNVKIAPIGKQMRSVKQSQGPNGDKLKPVAKKKGKKKSKLAKESFENFLDSVISEAQQCS